MCVIEPVRLSDLAESGFISTKEMALNLSLAYDGQICFLGYVTQSDYTNIQHRIRSQAPRRQFDAARLFFRNNQLLFPDPFVRFLLI